MKSSIVSHAMEHSGSHLDIEIPSWLFSGVRPQTIPFFTMPLEIRQAIYDCIIEEILVPFEPEPIEEENPDADSTSPTDPWEAVEFPPPSQPEVSLVVKNAHAYQAFFASNKTLRDEFQKRLFTGGPEGWLAANHFGFEDCIELSSFVKIIPTALWCRISGKIKLEHLHVATHGPFPSLVVDNNELVHLTCSQSPTYRHPCRGSEGWYMDGIHIYPLANKMWNERKLTWSRSAYAISYYGGDGRVDYSLSIEDRENKFLVLDGDFTRKPYFRNLLLYGLWQQRGGAQTFVKLVEDNKVSGLQ